MHAMLQDALNDILIPHHYENMLKPFMELSFITTRGTRQMRINPIMTKVVLSCFMVKDIKAQRILLTKEEEVI